MKVKEKCLLQYLWNSFVSQIYLEVDLYTLLVPRKFEETSIKGVVISNERIHAFYVSKKFRI